jgi:hypothetical protein
MSWRLLPLLTVLVVACASGKMRVKKGEPQTAREKMLVEEKAKAKKNKDGGTTADDGEVKPPGSKKWAKWRYEGDRKECFFLVGRKCFKTEKAACSAAKCKAPSTCETEGAGPAMMSCSGDNKKAAADDDKKSDKKPDKKSDDKKPDDKKPDDKKPEKKKKG